MTIGNGSSFSIF